MRRAVVSFGYHYFDSNRRSSVKTASISSIISIRPALLAAIVILATVAPTASRADSASFQGLGFLSGNNLSQANGVSGDGKVVVGYSNPDKMGAAPSQAFRWTASGGMVGLGTLSGDFTSYAYGVNGDGTVVVGGSMPVIPPPGSPGGDPNIRPK